MAAVNQDAECVQVADVDMQEVPAGKLVGRDSEVVNEEALRKAERIAAAKEARQEVKQRKAHKVKERRYLYVAGLLSVINVVFCTAIWIHVPYGSEEERLVYGILKAVIACLFVGDMVWRWVWSYSQGRWDVTLVLLSICGTLLHFVHSSLGQDHNPPDPADAIWFLTLAKVVLDSRRICICCHPENIRDRNQQELTREAQPTQG